MNKEQKMVLDFHKKYGGHVGTYPSNLPIDLRKLRLSLMYEELYEVDDALINGDVNKIAKELADLLYVVYGTAVSCGLDMEEIFAEVHNSNMTKELDNKRKDGKVLKGRTYNPPSISAIIGKQISNTFWREYNKGDE